MRILRLPLAEIGRLKDIEPTPAPDPWAKEAEEFVFGGELAEFVRRHKDELSIMIAEQEGVVIAVGVMYPDPRFFATRLGSIVVDQRDRRSGFGMAMLQAMVSEALETGTACWLVHPSNAGMLICSRRVEPKPDEALIDDGYMMFIAP
jgi:GNAT superfamily N-acetyltransferase